MTTIGPSATAAASPTDPASRAPADDILEVSELTVTAPHLSRPLVDRVSFRLSRGEVAGVAGESGSGKSLTCLAILSLLPRGLRVTAGSVRFAGQELVGLSERRLRAVRGSQISFVFQDPMTSLNPAMSVGEQVEEGLRLHTSLGRREARERVISWLDRVGIPGARKRYHARPSEFSGGMRQRVMIAMALASEPKLLIADEPTTALDVTIQAQVLGLIRELQHETGISLILVTHDLGVARSMCETVNVLYSGQIVEQGGTDAVFAAPAHPYTRGLLASVPSLAHGEEPPVGIPGSPPRGGSVIEGCRFYARCPVREDRCRPEPIPLRSLGSGRVARCLLAEEVGQ